jgi:hypothetical protein
MVRQQAAGLQMLYGMVCYVEGILIYPQLTEMCRSQWPLSLTRGSEAAHLMGMQVRIPPGSWISVSFCVFCAVR